MSKIVIRDSTNKYWPKWFSITNYACLSSLTVEEFLHELEHRLNLFYVPRSPQGRKPRDDATMRSITTGQPIVASHNTKRVCSRQTPNVIALSTEDLKVLTQTENSSSSYLHKGINKQESLLLALDIKSTDTPTLLKNVEYLINQARNEDNISAPPITETAKAQEKTLKKIFTYQLVPYLDLQLYRYAHNATTVSEWRPFKFTQKAYINLLYNNQISDDVFKATRHPFLKKILFDDTHRERLFANIRSERELLSRKIENL